MGSKIVSDGHRNPQIILVFRGTKPCYSSRQRILVIPFSWFQICDNDTFKPFTIFYVYNVFATKKLEYYLALKH